MTLFWCWLSGLVMCCSDLIKELQSSNQHNSTADASSSVSTVRVIEEDKMFKPHIYPYSYKLAERREQKEQSSALQANAGTGSGIQDESTLEGGSVTEQSSQISKKSTFHDRLLARGVLVAKLKESKAEEIRKQELDPCTFKPHLQAVFRKTSKLHPNANEEINISEVEGEVEELPGSPGVDYTPSVHQRLYSNGTNYKTKKPTEHTTPNYVHDLQLCTFKPKIRPLPSYLKHSSIDKPAIAGYDKTIKRFKEVADNKLKAKELDEKAFEMNQASYIKSREVARKGPEPFKLATEERIQKLKESAQQPVTPNLIIDVKLGAAKNARIRVSNGDDPVELSQKFGKIYGLDQSAVNVLATVVRKSMVRSGLLVLGQDTTFFRQRGVASRKQLDLGGSLLEGEEEYSSYTITSGSSEEDSVELADDDGQRADGSDSELFVSPSHSRDGRPSGIETSRGNRTMRSSLLSSLL
jgi:hypothetical protein